MKVINANRENIKRLREDSKLPDTEREKHIKESEDIIWKFIFEEWGTMDLQKQKDSIIERLSKL